MKEILKAVYLNNIKWKYRFMRLRMSEKENSVLFISTFAENDEQIKNKIPDIYYNKMAFDPRETPMNEQLKMIRKAKVIFVDNYYFPFAVMNLKDKKVVQIWHANGAVKKFGLASPKVASQSKRARKRYQAVYNRFTHITVGSEAMKNVFMESFNINDERKFIKCGFPRTDEIINLQYVEKAHKVIQKYPDTYGKIIILYVPTFRDSKKENMKQVEFIKQMVEKTSDEFVVYYHLHPEISAKLSGNIEGAHEILSSDLKYFFEYSNLLITDYSSVIFEASLRNHPQAFFMYDYEQYKESQGLFVEKEDLPGFVTEDFNELLTYIKEKNYSKDKLPEFNQKWNQYNEGNSGRKLIIETFKREKKNG